MPVGSAPSSHVIHVGAHQELHVGELHEYPDRERRGVDGDAVDKDQSPEMRTRVIKTRMLNLIL